MINPKLYEVYSKEIIDSLTPMIEDMEKNDIQSVAVCRYVYRNWALPAIIGVEGNCLHYLDYVQGVLDQLLTEDMLEESDYLYPTTAPLTVVENEGGIPLWIK